MKNKKYKSALKDYFAAMEYPENLGTGRPSHPVFIRENYYIGLCYKKLGERDTAEKYFRYTENEKTEVASINTYYRALALRGLGKEREAEGLLKDMKARSEDVIQQDRRVSPQHYLWASMSCHALGDDTRAKEYLTKAIELDPSYRWVAFFAFESGLLR
jgi:tetratricopeptide (TPR) repeat protein